MNRRIRYHVLFNRDVRDAADWYDQRSPGLGEMLIGLVESRIRDVVDSPDRFARTLDGIRYASVPRFPYIVLFRTVSDEIRFIGVLHTARDDAKWRVRQADF